MEAYDLKDILDMGSAYGLTLNSKIERRCVNGIWGMYATDTITDGEVLVSSHTPNLIEASDTLEYLTKCAIEFEMGDKSKMYPWFRSIGEIDSYKNDSVYYISDDELDTIKLLSPIIAHKIKLYNNRILDIVSKMESEHNIQRETAELMVLISESRKWNAGFMPVFDLFNHSLKRGNPMYKVTADNGDTWLFLARGVYNKGDEIFVSYSVKDTLKYSLGFNFYNESDIHMIDITSRLLFKINDELDEAILKKLKESYSITQHTDISAYSINKPIMLVDGAPSADLIKLVESISYNSIEDFNNNTISYEKFDTIMLDWLTSASHKTDIVKINEDGGIPVDKITPLVERFILLINKERTLIEKGFEWVIGNSNVFPNRFLTQLLPKLV